MKILEPYITEVIDGERVAFRNKQYWEKSYLRQYEIDLKNSGIPKEYWDIEFSDYKGKKSITNRDRVIRYATEVYDNRFHDINLYLYGGYSTQKTALACNIGKSFLKHKCKVRFVYAAELIDMILQTQGYGKGEEVSDKVQDFMCSDLLIIDDIFDVRKGTYWKDNADLIISAWEKFLRRYLSEDRRAIFTSCCPMSDVSIKFGDGIPKVILNKFVELTFADCIDNIRRKRLKNLWS